MTTLANFISDAGLARAPPADGHTDLDVRQGPEAFPQLNIVPVPAAAREFRCRMAPARQLDEECHNPALGDRGALNVMLPLYCGSQQSRNCMVIRQQVSDAAPGSGKARARLHHCKPQPHNFRH